MAENNDGGLYLIVGGLLVAAIVFGFVVWGRSGTTTSYTNIAPAAGTPSSYSSSTTTEKSTTATPDSDRDSYNSGTEQRSTTTTTHTP